MRDLFREIASSISRNKLRTCLTGFAVAWGIFMLIVLLGAGNGLVNAMSVNGDRFASNTMKVGGGLTSKPYDGLQAGRFISLEDRDIELTGSRAFAENIDLVSATVGTSVTVVNGKHYFSGYIEGNFPGRLVMDKIDIVHGRFINNKDIADRRKVAVFPENIAEHLLDDGVPTESLLGRRVKIGDLEYLVVGISKSEGMRNDNLFYAPYTTIKTVFGKGKEIDDLTFTFHGLETKEENEAFEKEYKAALNVSHRAAPDDERAVWIWNRFTQNLQMAKATSVVNIALWIIGIFTLLGGIVGVSNIMLITVRERTHEFGIRKAIGATPWKIMFLIISESIVITSVFGYVGMFLGMWCCRLLDKTVGSSPMTVMGEQQSMLVNPSVGLDVALEATLLLVIAGTVAGLIPSLKAVKVKPIEALRVE